VSFISLHFPYYNYRLAECAEQVRSTLNLGTEDPNSRAKVTIETLVNTAQQIETAVQENRSEGSGTYSTVCRFQSKLAAGSHALSNTFITTSEILIFDFPISHIFLTQSGLHPKKNKGLFGWPITRPEEMQKKYSAHYMLFSTTFLVLLLLLMPVLYHAFR
jgi:hypothetical protein